ncbi:prepilin-type N-terminal cleavage/methylation domain-containing protein [Anaerovorax odorimutans]|uniref:Prepilin-type N-terminal cleavage/methylation domain-containing protein n=1 Tax=Anaerovorax odorimutans TaxID=109327 RepID=A0ABT1RS93_9FIRM|nr:prepilin-type N-terminal cleavage/methylation domain-containing protein [Anaerovorax odorimutans]MCQ4638026.1 prepilin-type N-terminal cleavage/methylation domain-containing protein [Anaerovorax odorimutans]
MFELVNKKRSELAKGKKKGFTLVEVIVVLVILAILAAILIPSMIGWIRKANEKTVLVEARNALLALQTVASMTYDPTAGTTGFDRSADSTKAWDSMKELTEDTNIQTKCQNLVVTNGNITSFTYQTNEYYVDYTGANKFADPVKGQKTQP